MSLQHKIIDLFSSLILSTHSVVKTHVFLEEAWKALIFFKHLFYYAVKFLVTVICFTLNKTCDPGCENPAKVISFVIYIKSSLIR